MITMDEEENIQEELNDPVCPRCGLRTYDDECPNCGTPIIDARDVEKKKEEEEEEYDWREKYR